MSWSWLIVAVLIATVAIWVAFEVFWVFYSDSRDARRAPFGFEVKLTDGTSVTAKKENDHG